MQTSMLAGKRLKIEMEPQFEMDFSNSVQIREKPFACLFVKDIDVDLREIVLNHQNHLSLCCSYYHSKIFISRRVMMSVSGLALDSCRRVSFEKNGKLEICIQTVT